MIKNIVALIVGVFFVSGIFYIVSSEGNTKEEEKTKEELPYEEDNTEKDNSAEEKEGTKTEEINENSETTKNKEPNNELSFIDCLADVGVVIYGSKTCPACRNLSDQYGGYDKIESIYVECTEERERCNKEMLVNYVPAVQINGEVFDGWGSPENLAKETRCKL